MFRRHIEFAAHYLLHPRSALSWKEFNELRYWRRRKQKEHELHHDHFELFYTTHFELEPSFYEGKKILDIGCGPRGSLEWAHMAAERVGLDPLADEYLALGAGDQAMNYVTAYSEDIPFPDAHFDVVCSFNSLDHVADLDATVAEIVRVTKPGGLFLLLSDLNHSPTACEPQAFSWEVVDRFRSAFEVVRERHYEKSGDGMYNSLMAAVLYDHADDTPRYGILSAKCRRRS